MSESQQGDGSSRQRQAQQSPTLHEAHGPGHTSVAWHKQQDGSWAALSAGADGKLLLRTPRGAQLRAAEISAGELTCLAVSPAGDWAATTDTHHLLKTWALPGLAPCKAALSRFTLPPRVACVSRDGALLAAGGDDAAIKVVTQQDSKVLATLRSGGYVRGLALDPEGAFLAAATADGSLSVWALPQGNGAAAAAAAPSSCKQELRKSVAAKLDHDDAGSRQPVAWHPDGGTLLAVAGRDADVVLLERLSWRAVSYLSGGHTGRVAALAFSPNGIYAATAGTDGKVVVWAVDSAAQVASCQLPCTASSLAWHPQQNALLLGGSDGGVGMWASPVPPDDASLPSPWQPMDEVLAQQDAAAAAAAAGQRADTADGGSAGGHDDLEDDDVELPEAAVMRRRGAGAARRQHADAAGADSAATGGTLDDLLDELDAAAEATTGGGSGGAPSRAAAGRFAAPQPRPQGAIQPGSTPAAGKGDAAGGSGGRFLAFNQLGCVVSRAVGDHHVVEVSFHDTSRHRLRVPALTDYYGFTLAALAPRGVAYASPPAGEEQPAMLVYRAFESWAGGSSDWSAALPPGEEPLVLAAGSSSVAVATSTRQLRLYSLAGRQLAVLSLPGPPVAAAAAVDAALASADNAGAAAVQHLLAVVWAAGPPEASSNTQQLAYAVYDTSRSCQAFSGALVLSPGSRLAWLGFSREGLLAAMDSAGALRLRSPDWGGAWTQVLDAAAAKAACGAELLWPAWLDSGSLMAVACSTKAPHPAVSPPPLLTRVALSVPAAAAENTPAALEEGALRAGLVLGALRAATGAAEDAEDAAALAEQLAAAQTEADRTALRLFNACLKSGKQARALELVGGLHALKSIEGALKLSNHHHTPALAERVQAFLEQRTAWEAEQEQQQQQQELAQHQAWVGDSDMQAQQDQGAAGSGAGQQPAAAVFGAAGRAAGIGGGGLAGGKRKPLLEAGDAGNRGGSSNPFARKRAAAK